MGVLTWLFLDFKLTPKIYLNVENDFFTLTDFLNSLQVAFFISY